MPSLRIILFTLPLSIFYRHILFRPRGLLRKLSLLKVLTTLMDSAESLRKCNVVENTPSSLPDRHFDLYFLNTVEHFAPAVSQKVSEEVILPHTSPYLAADLEPSLHPHFEAAHSVMLAIIGSPPSADLGAHILPFYVIPSSRHFRRPSLHDNFALHLEP